MTPEQQQRIAEIEARQPERAEWQYGKDIDFLLSLVQSQEADSSGGDLLLRREVVERIEKQIRLYPIRQCQRSGVGSA